MSIWRRLRTFLGGAQAPPPPPAPAPRRPRGSAPRAPAFQPLDDPAAPPPATVRWQKEQYGPKARAPEWIRRVSKRQRILVAIAAISLLAMGVAFAAKLTIERRLPAAVQGVWRGSSPAYADHYLELHAQVVAYTTGDSTRPIAVQQITRVRRTPHTHGVLYTIEYVEDGATFEISVVHDTSRPDALHFAHQMTIPWNRVNTNRSLIPSL